MDIIGNIREKWARFYRRVTEGTARPRLRAVAPGDRIGGVVERGTGTGAVVIRVEDDMLVEALSRPDIREGDRVVLEVTAVSPVVVCRILSRKPADASHIEVRA